jgi:hypothetical protein
MNEAHRGRLAVLGAVVAGSAFNFTGQVGLGVIVKPQHTNVHVLIPLSIFRGLAGPAAAPERW